MKAAIIILTLAAFAVGCTTTNQRTGELQRDFDAQGNVIKETEITTDTKVSSKLQSAQKAKSINSSNTPDGQTVSIADLDQSSDAATLAAAVSASVDSAVTAAVKALMTQLGVPPVPVPTPEPTE